METAKISGYWFIMKILEFFSGIMFLNSDAITCKICGAFLCLISVSLIFKLINHGNLSFIPTNLIISQTVRTIWTISIIIFCIYTVTGNRTYIYEIMATMTLIISTLFNDEIARMSMHNEKSA